MILEITIEERNRLVNALMTDHRELQKIKHLDKDFIIQMRQDKELVEKLSNLKEKK